MKIDNRIGIVILIVVLAGVCFAGYKMFLEDPPKLTPQDVLKMRQNPAGGGGAPAGGAGGGTQAPAKK